MGRPKKKEPQTELEKLQAENLRLRAKNVLFKKRLCQHFDTTSLSVCCVGLPGFEPGMTGPESVVLPLHHSPIEHFISVLRCKDTNFSLIQNIFRYFFH